MRIAWLGPVGENGGAASLGALLLEGVLDGGSNVEFFTEEGVRLPPSLAVHPNLTVAYSPSWWRWGKWYSRRSMTAFASGMIAQPSTQSHMRYDLGTPPLKSL